jgi:hypothetical protein
VTVLRYTLLRFMLLFAVLLVLWLLLAAIDVHNPLLLIVLTLVISVPLSYVVLKGPRLAMTQTLADRMATRTAEVDTDADAEDAEAAASAEAEGERDQDAEGELGAARVAQGGDELATGPAADDGEHGGPQQRG